MPYLEPFELMKEAFVSVYEDLQGLDNPCAIGERDRSFLSCRICIGGGDLVARYRVLESITATNELSYPNDESSLGVAWMLREKENLYFEHTFTYDIIPRKTLYSLNLVGLMDSDVLCLGFNSAREFDKWLTSMEYEYLTYMKPWLQSKLVVVQGEFDRTNPLFQGLNVISYEELYGIVSENFLVDRNVEGHIGDSWFEILNYLGIKTTSWVPKGGFIDTMTPIPFNGESQLETLLVGQTEITQGLYEYVTGGNPSRFVGSRELPVDKVSWFDLLHFCNKLSEMQGFRPCYYDIGSGREGSAEWDRSANGYRLLTEKEFEYIAEANRTFLYSGSRDHKEVAWYDEDSGYETHPVGTKKGNAFGTYDQSGNLYEWCWDLGRPKHVNRIVRGGAWYCDPHRMRAADRYANSFTPSEGTDHVGGRLARTPDP